MIEKEIAIATESELRAYLAGASRDGYTSRHHSTFRFTQANEVWLRNISLVLDRLDHASWIYREGRRDVWVLETSFRPDRVPMMPSAGDTVAYLSAYFDAEGGMPHSATERLYFQFVQKDRQLLTVKHYLERVDVSCGRIHNPSVRVDPNYWRLFVRAPSHRRFLQVIRSWHRAKRSRMEERLSMMQGAG